MPVISTLVMLLYIAAPMGIFAYAVRRWRKNGEYSPMIAVVTAWVGGVVAALGFIWLNVWLLAGDAPALDYVRAIWVGMAAASIIKAMDWGTMVLAMKLVGKTKSSGLWARLAALGILLCQRGVVLLLAIVWVLGLLVSLRPRVAGGPTPTSYRLAYQPASFHAEDGVAIAAWFLPGEAQPVPRRRGQPPVVVAPETARTTVIVCHGIGSRKELQLGTAALLVSQGYNVLLFDFRAHGDSGGHAISYGDRERLDVLAAVQYLKQEQPSQAERIVGIGTNMGAAALMGATADPRGAAIDDLVLVAPYANFANVAEGVAPHSLPQWVRNVVTPAVLEVAGWHAGSALPRYEPQDFAEALWPRPVLVVHGRGLSFVPPLEELDLSRAIPPPREDFWSDEGSTDARAVAKRSAGDMELLQTVIRQWMGLRENELDDPTVRQRLLEFIAKAKPAKVL